MEINSTAIQPLSLDNVSDPNSVRRATAIKDPTARAEAVASQLETVFFGMMVKAMRATIPEGGLLGKGLGGESYVEMLDQQMAQLGGLPRDPRFHEALVKQIIQSPDAAGEALAKMDQANASGDKMAGPKVPDQV